MTSELITVEYAGHASRQVGTLPCHDVRAWWRVVDEQTIERVKLAARREVKRHVKDAHHVEYAYMDLSTYSHPNLDAMITFRVLTREQFATRARLRALVVTACAQCGSDCPSYYLRASDGSEQAVCHPCLNALPRDLEYRTLAWVKANGRLQI